MSERICQDQAVCLHHLVLMADRTVMEQFAAAVEKIRKNTGELLTQQELASK